MYIVLVYENVMSLMLFLRSVVGCHVLKVKTVYTGFGICPVCRCYATEIL